MSLSVEVERLHEEIKRLQNVREVTDVGIQFNYLAPMSGNFVSVKMSHCVLA